jgi:putative DNA primase/helicase
MELRGTRLAAIEETPEARKLSVARLKKTVGTPKITARYIRDNSVTFDATHSLFLSSNYLPIIEETDHGTWRRLALMKYPYTFRKHPDEMKGPLDRLGDPGLRQRVDEGRDGQHEAALAWLVTGAQLWHALDRVMPPPPEDVTRDTKTWRTESDLILAYIDERLVMDAGSVILSADLVVDLNEWLRAKGHRSWSEKLLASRLAGHDEIVRNRVVKERMRLNGSVTTTGERVSRPVHNPFSGPRLESPGQQPHVWRGIAFQP